MCQACSQDSDLPDAILTDSGLKITPLDSSVPQSAQRLIDHVAASLPHIKITGLLLEVDTLTAFTAHFTHLKSGDAAKDRIPLLTAILAESINMGLTKMAESCPGTSYAKLADHSCLPKTPFSGFCLVDERSPSVIWPS